MKQLLFPLAVLATSWLGAAPCAHAQADESWYQKALKHNASANQQKSTQLRVSTPASRQASSTGTGARNVVNACDVMVNGGFETQLATPSHVNNMGGDYAGSAFGGTNRSDQLSNWYSPTAGSPDYFATNATATSEVQPANENSPYGSFTPYLATSNNDGLEGAIGLYARQNYYDSNTNTLRDRTSEYAQVNLNTALPSGRYYVDFQVSLSHNTSTSLATNYGVNSGFGLVFTTTASLSVINGGPSTPTLNSRDFLEVPATAQTVFNQSPIAQNAINNGVTGAANWQRVSGQISSTGNLQYVTAGLFNADPSNQIALPNRRTDLRNTYFFVDAIRIFKIPTAGTAATTFCGGSITIGEGCPIPGATYTWSAPGITGLPSNSSSVQTTVTPATNTTYTLTVNLPDGNNYSSTVNITVNSAASTPPPAPIVIQTGQDQCLRQAYYTITNYNPAFTYQVNTAYSSPSGVTAVPAAPLTSTFRIKGSFNAVAGSFTITATDARCSTSVSATSPEYYVEFQCNDGTFPSTNITTAYPNPANESFTIPKGAKSATLLNGQGLPIQQVNKAGQVDVQNLPDGLYNLQMIQDGKLINQRIQVKH
jgi:hypothetical protein